ncbi:MAG: putative DNA-binding domain-containing protein [Gammaproteobacteria bacterium]|nr:putative DNA-binding domain-containing protein [Gammaproteobacteria bacterium]
MTKPVEGQNLPKFQALQLDFAAHIRNPELNPIPDGIEPRRMAIYNRLFYNNIESFCSMRFERTKKILGEERWNGMIRDFVHRHQCKSPYFAQISEEFIAYLAMDRSKMSDPPFLVELCHYEWLPLYFDRMVGVLPSYKPCADPLGTKLKTSELSLVRRYVWPVNKISVDSQPVEPPEKPTWALGFRNRADKVDVKHVDAFTANLVETLRTPMTGLDAIQTVLGDSAKLDKMRLERLSSRLDDLVELDVLVVAD